MVAVRRSARIAAKKACPAKNKRTAPKSKATRKQPPRAAKKAPSPVVDGGNVRTAVSSGRGLKISGTKKGKGPSVSKTFVQKVQKALLPRASVGSYVTYIGGHLNRVVLANAQASDANLYEADNTTLVKKSTVAIAGIFNLFTLYRILDGASVLFNAKTAAHQYVTTTTNFEPKSVKIDVVHQSATVKCRNNTQVVKELIWYICEAKQDSAEAAVTDWSDKLSSASSTTTPNFMGATVSTYGLTPGKMQSFSDKWKVGVKKFIMSPGQSVEFTVMGPRQLYDFEKIVETLPLIQKGGVSLMYTIRNVEVESRVDAAGLGHGAYAAATEAHMGIMCEIVYRQKILAPSLTVDTLNFTKFGQLIYAIDNPIGIGSSVYKVDPVNPISRITGPYH